MTCPGPDGAISGSSYARTPVCCAVLHSGGVIMLPNTEDSGFHPDDQLEVQRRTNDPVSNDGSA